MKNIKNALFVLLSAALATSCGPSLKVTSDYDKSANFQQYKTFAIDTFRMNQRISQLNANRITNAIKAEMVKKGFTENTSGPDLKINVAAVLKDQKSVSSTTDYYGYGGVYRPWAWGGGLGATGYTTYNVQNYKDGSLIIDIADAKTNNLVWEGIGNEEIDKPVKDPDTQIPAAIASIMKNFPPGAAK
ncbi:MAG TPA: DUF4136 domain-containing protein [Parafilimonas sp.]|nr:DUF4136 domain-containing protein [Parafilimonas sp.]